MPVALSAQFGCAGFAKCKPSSGRLAQLMHSIWRIPVARLSRAGAKSIVGADGRTSGGNPLLQSLEAPSDGSAYSDGWWHLAAATHFRKRSRRDFEQFARFPGINKQALVFWRLLTTKQGILRRSEPGFPFLVKVAAGKHHLFQAWPQEFGQHSCSILSKRDRQLNLERRHV
jgi:hypothetical protein